MKFKNLCTVLVVIFMLLTTSVSAYSTDTYSIDINEEEYEMTSEEGITLFQKLSGDNIVVQEIQQKAFGGKLTQYQLNTISQEIVDQYQDQYQATVTETAREEITINDYTVTKMAFKTDVSGYEIYQEMNIFVSANRIYDIIFTSVSADGFSEEEKNTILNSFKILGDEAATNNSVVSGTTNSTELTVNPEMNAVWIQLGVVIVIAVILMIFAIKRNPKSKLYLLAIVLILFQGLAIKSAELQGMVAEDITSDVAFNIGFFVFAIIGIILLIVQLCKKPKVVETKKEKQPVQQAIAEEQKEPESDNPIQENQENKDNEDK